MFLMMLLFTPTVQTRNKSPEFFKKLYTFFVKASHPPHRIFKLGHN